MASASFAGVLGPVLVTTPSYALSNCLSTRTSFEPGATKTVACSAAGMFHSRPWKTRVSGWATRASRMSGLTLFTPSLACATEPWSVITIQSRPYWLAWLTWSSTRYWASLLYWVWTWWSPDSQR